MLNCVSRTLEGSPCYRSGSCAICTGPASAHNGGYFVVLGHEYVTVAIVHGKQREPQRSLIATRKDSKALL